MEARGSFTRYLEAKRTVDDRALNRQVWEALAGSLPATTRERPLEVLEVGAGTGAMFRRSVEWGLLKHARYTAVDRSGENIAAGLERLPLWGRERGYSVHSEGDELLFEQAEALQVRLRMISADIYDLLEAPSPREIPAEGGWALLVAHAFLDLVDLSRALPALMSALRPGGFFYFPITFDGLSCLEPQVDPALDDLIMGLYHRSMDERVDSGARAGDSRTGRRLFAALRDFGGQVLAAGSSDWVVFPGPEGYPHQEAEFLHHILNTIEAALRGNPRLPRRDLERWTAVRRAQVERQELVYIAHQVDVMGRKTGSLPA